MNGTTCYPCISHTPGFMRGTPACWSLRSRQACWDGRWITQCDAWLLSLSIPSNRLPSLSSAPTQSMWSTSTWGMSAPEEHVYLCSNLNSESLRTHTWNKIAGPLGFCLQLLSTIQQTCPPSGGTKLLVLLVALSSSTEISSPFSSFSSWWKPLFLSSCPLHHTVVTPLPPLLPLRKKAAILPFCFRLHRFTSSFPLPWQNKEGAVGRRGWNKCKWRCRESDWCATEVGAAGSRSS